MALRSLPSLSGSKSKLRSSIRWFGRFLYSVGLTGVFAFGVLFVLAFNGGRPPRPMRHQDVHDSSARRICPFIDYPAWRERVLPAFGSTVDGLLDFLEPIE